MVWLLFLNKNPWLPAGGVSKNFQQPQVMVLQDKNWQLGILEKNGEPPPPKKTAPKSMMETFGIAPCCAKKCLFFFFRCFCFSRYFFVVFGVFLFLVFSFQQRPKWKIGPLQQTMGSAFVFVGREGCSWIYSPGKYHISPPNGKRKIIDSKVPNRRGYVRSLEGRYMRGCHEVFIGNVDPDVKVSDGKKYKTPASIKR